MFFLKLKKIVGIVICMCIVYFLCILLIKAATLTYVKKNFISEIQPLQVIKNVKPIGKVNLNNTKNSEQNALEATFSKDLNNSIPTLTSNQSKSTNPAIVTCSIKASLSGSNQKVITYTIYGDTPSYWRGFPEIMVQAKILYPGWYIRVYTDNPNYEVLKNLSQNFSFLQICDVNNFSPPNLSLKEYPSMMWRFYPLGDPQVDVILFRDSDSELLVREHDAVEEWLVRTPKALHIMRDHPYHGTEILGGMWGARITPATRNKWREMRDTMFAKSHRSARKKQLDQELLRTVVWPAFNGDFIAHDSYTCRRYPGSVPFPTQRTNDAFVGSQYYSYYGYGKLFECPEECRPDHHKDWIYC